MSCKHDLDNCPECGPFARAGGAMTFAENRLVERLSRAPGLPAAAAGISSPPPSGSASLQSGRVICPACGRKGLGYAAHPHAYGWKDYSRASCRYCQKRFAVKQKPNIPLREE
jgi:hypothetical protein